MGELDKLMRIVTAIHEASFDPGAWQPALTLVGELLNSNGVVLALDDQRRGFASSFEGATAPEARHAYLTQFHQIDPVIDFVRRAPAKRAYSDHMAIPRDVLQRTRFHAEFATRFDYSRCMQAFTHRSGSSSGFFVAARSRWHEPFEDVERGLLECLIPHFEQALRVRALLHRADLERDGAFAALDHVREGVVLVDAALRIRFANAEACRLLRSGSGLVDVGCKLAAVRASDQMRLRKAVSWTAGRAPGHAPTVFAVARAAPLRPLFLRVAPVGAALADRLGDMEPGALVFIGDADAARVDPEAVGAVLGLTPAEADVASLLASGLDVTGLTSRLRVSEATVRTHLRRIFAKTQTGRQSQLVALINAVPVRSADGPRTARAGGGGTRDNA